MISLRIIKNNFSDKRGNNNNIMNISLVSGSYFKKFGYWKNDLDEPKIIKFVEKYNFLTGK